MLPMGAAKDARCILRRPGSQPVRWAFPSSFRGVLQDLCVRPCIFQQSKRTKLTGSLASDNLVEIVTAHGKVGGTILKVLVVLLLAKLRVLLVVGLLQLV